MPENRHSRFFLTLFYIALALFCLWLIFNYAIGWLAPFIIAFIVSRIIEKPVCFFQKKLKLPRPLSSALFTILFYGIIGTALYFALSAIVKELVVLFEKLGSLDINVMVSRLNNTFIDVLSKIPLEMQDFIYSNIEGWLSEFVSALRNLIGPVISSATNVAAALPSIMIFVIAAIVSTYFLSCDFEFLKKTVVSVLPDKWRLRFRQTREQVSNTLISYLRALLVLISITFVELSIGLAVLRVPNSFLIAAVIAIIDALPILGTGWILMPWAIISLFAKNYVLAIGLAVIYAVVVIVRNMIEPKIVGKHIGLHPLITLMAMYIGLKMFGIIGMFMPIPIALLKQFYEWGYFDFLKRTQNNQ
ncbi:MAG: sporulation integral membrane protein YtvI [Oscillospiraceae bacterium]|nr:sporulation integral membrane protein YtvI [Oscillospiraceae bacterium]